MFGQYDSSTLHSAVMNQLPLAVLVQLM